MKIPDFELERFQSLYEHQVDYNLSESGVHPLKVRDLLPDDALEAFLGTELIYEQTNGPAHLREGIALLYQGVSSDNILVTNGAIEANFLASLGLFEAGDEIVYMLPNYVQIQGLADSWGVTVKAFQLRAENAWQPDLAEVAALISPKTKAIVLCNPNNPTGVILKQEARQGLIQLAQAANAWIFVDEIYRGTEHSGSMIDSFWGQYDKVIVTASLSKAFGLPGLRIGWLIAPEAFIETAWGHKDYTSITAGTLSYALASRALEPTMRQHILGRNRDLVKTNLAVLQAWIATQGGLLSLSPPQAGAMAFMNYQADIPSSVLSNYLHQHKSILVVPGQHFGLEHYLRLGYGLETHKLRAALERITEGLEELELVRA